MVCPQTAWRSWSLDKRLLRFPGESCKYICITQSICQSAPLCFGRSPCLRGFGAPVHLLRLRLHRSFLDKSKLNYVVRWENTRRRYHMKCNVFLFGNIGSKLGWWEWRNSNFFLYYLQSIIMWVCEGDWVMESFEQCFILFYLKESSAFFLFLLL